MSSAPAIRGPLGPRWVQNATAAPGDLLGAAAAKWRCHKAEGTGLEPVRVFPPGGFQVRCGALHRAARGSAPQQAASRGRGPEATETACKRPVGSKWVQNRLACRIRPEG